MGKLERKIHDTTLLIDAKEKEIRNARMNLSYT